MHVATRLVPSTFGTGRNVFLVRQALGSPEGVPSLVAPGGMEGGFHSGLEGVPHHQHFSWSTESALAGGGVEKEKSSQSTPGRLLSPKTKYCRQGADPEAGASTDLDGAL